MPDDRMRSVAEARNRMGFGPLPRGWDSGLYRVAFRGGRMVMRDAVFNGSPAGW